MYLRQFAVLSALLMLGLGCRAEMPDVNPEAPTLRRLTNDQFSNTIRDLLGADVVIPGELDPDSRVAGFLSVGASVAAFSPRGTENIETFAYFLAEQAMAEERRDTLMPCAPAAVVDAECSRQFVEEFGRRAWRRPLISSEVERMAGLADLAADTLGDFHDGLEFAIAGLLQAPDFLYRVELGADSDGELPRRYTDWELASRLSYLLWNSTPDNALLDAAEAGLLSTEDGLLAEVERLLDAPRSLSGLQAWFADMMHLADLPELYKEASVFPHMSDTLPEAARQEALRTFAHVAFDTQGDLRDLVTTRTTFVNRELAALYDLRAPLQDGFAAVEHGEGSMRRGLLGQVAFLGLNAHPVSSSATLRGKFIREVFLCTQLPGPPADADTSIPPVTETARTLRDRVQMHLTDPGCAGCHRSMDLVGLGLENFDGIARFRTTEEGAPIDASGELDDLTFMDAPGLSDALHDNEGFAPCLVKSLVRYSNGHREEPGQFEALKHLGELFAADGHRLEPMILELTTSPLFIQAGAIDTSPIEEGWE
jgi:hypothetical protein